VHRYLSISAFRHSIPNIRYNFYVEVNRSTRLIETFGLSAKLLHVHVFQDHRSTLTTARSTTHYSAHTSSSFHDFSSSTHIHIAFALGLFALISPRPDRKTPTISDPKHDLNQPPTQHNQKIILPRRVLQQVMTLTLCKVRKSVTLVAPLSVHE